jgi:hypothetical protein
MNRTGNIRNSSGKMMDSISFDILPDLISILECGIPFGYPMEPVAAAQCCKLNMEQEDGVTATGNLNQITYVVHGRRIANVLWFADGVEFMVLWSSPQFLSQMVRIVQNTIEEMQDG